MRLEELSSIVDKFVIPVAEQRVVVQVGIYPQIKRKSVIMEKSIAEAKEILDKRREGMEQVMKEVQGNIEKVSSTLEQLGSEIQSTMEQA